MFCAGAIPVELGNLLQLTILEVAGNKLTGRIPIELGNLSQLTSLWLSKNKLTGTIPIELGDLSNLTRLWLNGNQLTGVQWCPLIIPTQSASSLNPVSACARADVERAKTELKAKLPGCRIYV